MSNIYILEPPTSAKVLLNTTAGDIEIELWSKETPKACRNFIQLCLEGYYNNTIFHRVVKDFIVQGGDPNGDGTGGESIYEEPFKDEFHQRLRFSRRGLVAMANAGKDDNGSQFFFTLGPTPELQNKHTIFGKVGGDTIFNIVKLAEGLVEDEKPVYPYKIIKTEVLNNPFTDIVLRVQQVEVKEKRKKEKKQGVKNFKLLSFGEEAEEDEEISTRESEKFSTKGKSSHDILNDPKLSSQTEDVVPNKEADKEENDSDTEKQLENIRKKLKTGHKKSKPVETPHKSTVDVDDDNELEEYYLHKGRDQEKEKKMEKLKKEIQSVKKEYHKNKLTHEDEKKEYVKDEKEKSSTFKEYKEEVDMYTKRKNSLPKKGQGREQFTLQLLESFKKKLHSVKENESEDVEEKSKDDVGKDENWLLPCGAPEVLVYVLNENHSPSHIDLGLSSSRLKNIKPVESLSEICVNYINLDTAIQVPTDVPSRLNHKLHFTDNLVLAKDANTKDDDWFEIYDPRNPLNKRRRGESSKSKK